jgi:hypothetical protein
MIQILIDDKCKVLLVVLIPEHMWLQRWLEVLADTLGVVRVIHDAPTSILAKRDSGGESNACQMSISP